MFYRPASTGIHRDFPMVFPRNREKRVAPSTSKGFPAWRGIFWEPEASAFVEMAAPRESGLGAPRAAGAEPGASTFAPFGYWPVSGAPHLRVRQRLGERKIGGGVDAGHVVEP